MDHRCPYLATRIPHEISELDVCILPDSTPLGLWKVLPKLAYTETCPLAQKRVLLILKMS
jgi:hypothetical protein